MPALHLGYQGNLSGHGFTCVVRPPAATWVMKPAGRVTVPDNEITGVILAGGLGRRMGGQDKGLLEIGGRPLVSRIIDTLQPQVGPLFINANRNLERYRGFGYPVIEDVIGDFSGPLAGMASALRAMDTPYLLTAPCDSPLLPHDLGARLYLALRQGRAEISVVHDGTYMQPVFALLRRELLGELLDFLERGNRKIAVWYRERRLALADFSDRRDAFLNINTAEEWAALEKASCK